MTRVMIQSYKQHDLITVMYFDQSVEEVKDMVLRGIEMDNHYCHFGTIKGEFIISRKHLKKSLITIKDKDEPV
jgi:hypothetical protein